MMAEKSGCSMLGNLEQETDFGVNRLRLNECSRFSLRLFAWLARFSAMMACELILKIKVKASGWLLLEMLKWIKRPVNSSLKVWCTPADPLRGTWVYRFNLCSSCVHQHCQIFTRVLSQQRLACRRGPFTRRCKRSFEGNDPRRQKTADEVKLNISWICRQQRQNHGLQSTPFIVRATC